MDTTTTQTTTAPALESLEKISRLFSALTLIEGMAAVKDPVVLSILSDIREAAGKALAVRQVVEGASVDLDRALTWTFCCVTCEARAVTPTGHSPVGWIVVTWTDCIGEYQEDWYCSACEAPAARALAAIERELRAEATGRGG